MESQRSDRDVVEGELREFFGACGDPVLCAYLFGSAARGHPRPADIDVAVLYAERLVAAVDGPHFRIEADLERRLGRPVHLIDLHRAPPDLVHRVLRDGRLVVDRDPSRRIAFEKKSRSEYFDLEPVRKEYRRLARKSR